MKLPDRQAWKRAARYIDSVRVISLADGQLIVNPDFSLDGTNEEGECGLGLTDRMAVADIVEELVNEALKQARGER